MFIALTFSTQKLKYCTSVSWICVSLSSHSHNFNSLNLTSTFSPKYHTLLKLSIILPFSLLSWSCNPCLKSTELKWTGELSVVSEEQLHDIIMITPLFSAAVSDCWCVNCFSLCFAVWNTVLSCDTQSGNKQETLSHSDTALFQLMWDFNWTFIQVEPEFQVLCHTLWHDTRLLSSEWI